MAAAPSSKRIISSPASLHAFVIDSDTAYLKELKAKFTKFYITVCNVLSVALDFMRNFKNDIDFVVCDETMPEITQFLVVVSGDMNIPVIMMASADDNRRRSARGLRHGAVDRLFKPVRSQEVEKIWQCFSQLPMADDAHNVVHEVPVQEIANNPNQDPAPTRKKKRPIDDAGNGKTAPQGRSKKRRVVWTYELNELFISVVNKLGIDNAGPKKILSHMKVDYLTRENVASHLQKYRLSLEKKQPGKKKKGSIEEQAIIEHANGSQGHTVEGNMLSNLPTPMPVVHNSHVCPPMMPIVNDSMASFNQFEAPVKVEDSQPYILNCYAYQPQSYLPGPDIGLLESSPSPCCSGYLGSVQEVQMSNLEIGTKNLSINPEPSTDVVPPNAGFSTNFENDCNDVIDMCPEEYGNLGFIDEELVEEFYNYQGN